MTDVIALPDHSAREHSPLGASGAERWMNCPGSVALIAALHDQIVALGLPLESDEPDYRREGTAMHEAAAHCLEKHLDTWEITGSTFNNTEIDDVMARHIQTYLDHCRGLMDPYLMRDDVTGEHQRVFIEVMLSSPKHDDMFGSIDFGLLRNDRIIVRDLKGGEGIVVEPTENPQLKYYAFLILEMLRLRGTYVGDEFPVDIGIVQPRAYHEDGPIRTWETTAGAIRRWVEAELLPAMYATEIDKELDAGSWCRFCPAKLVCPMLTSLFRAACIADPKEVVNYNDATIGRSYEKVQAVKFYLKALEEETLRRLMQGRTFENDGAKTAPKLVRKKANRVFKDGASGAAYKEFQADAFTKPELKSPADVERIGPEGVAFVKRWAYQPNTGYTVAPASDPRPAEKIRSTSENFGAALAAQGVTT